MGLGPQLYMVWFVVLLFSWVSAGIHVKHRQSNGIRLSLASVLGGLMSWTLVSAYIGWCEIDGYARSAGFALSLMIGIAGILFVTLSGLKLKSSRKEHHSKKDLP